MRDGSYAVDFKLTERDTEVLATVLGRLGFKWIEVGHGLGLGAAQAGKGTMPTTDERLIECAKRAAPDARIGSFFIPGVGTKDQLRSHARRLGMMTKSIEAGIFIPRTNWYGCSKKFCGYFDRCEFGGLGRKVVDLAPPPPEPELKPQLEASIQQVAEKKAYVKKPRKNMQLVLGGK